MSHESLKLSKTDLLAEIIFASASQCALDALKVVRSAKTDKLLAQQEFFHRFFAAEIFGLINFACELICAGIVSLSHKRNLSSDLNWFMN